jgi:hypothetical protein
MTVYKALKNAGSNSGEEAAFENPLGKGHIPTNRYAYNETVSGVNK